MLFTVEIFPSSLGTTGLLFKSRFPSVIKPLGRGFGSGVGVLTPASATGGVTGSVTGGFWSSVGTLSRRLILGLGPPISGNVTGVVLPVCSGVSSSVSPYINRLMRLSNSSSSTEPYIRFLMRWSKSLALFFVTSLHPRMGIKKGSRDIPGSNQSSFTMLKVISLQFLQDPCFDSFRAIPFPYSFLVCPRRHEGRRVVIDHSGSNGLCPCGVTRCYRIVIRLA